MLRGSRGFSGAAGARDWGGGGGDAGQAGGGGAPGVGGPRALRGPAGSAALPARERALPAARAGRLRCRRIGRSKAGPNWAGPEADPPCCQHVPYSGQTLAEVPEVWRRPWGPRWVAGASLVQA